MVEIKVNTAHTDIDPDLLDVDVGDELYISKGGLAEYKIYIASNEPDLKMYMCKIVREDGEDGAGEYIEGYVPVTNLNLEHVLKE